MITTGSVGLDILLWSIFYLVVMLPVAVFIGRFIKYGGSADDDE